MTPIGKSSKDSHLLLRSQGQKENEKPIRKHYLGYSESTQVLGYTAIGGPTDSGGFSGVTIDLGTSRLQKPLNLDT